MGGTFTVGRAKTANGTGRTIPFNDDLASYPCSHRTWFVKRFGEPRGRPPPLPLGQAFPADPARHATDITWGRTSSEGHGRLL